MRPGNLVSYATNGDLGLVVAAKVLREFQDFDIDLVLIFFFCQAQLIWVAKKSLVELA